MSEIHDAGCKLQDDLKNGSCIMHHFIRGQIIFMMQIGTTSYIYPDEIIPNVSKLANLIDDIELVLFEGKDYSNLPSKQDVRTLREISLETGISYTVHLPIDLDICSKDADFRTFSLNRMIEIMKLTYSLNPRGYIVHLPRREVESEEMWVLSTVRSLSEIFIEFGNEKVSIENLSYPIRHILPIIEEFDFKLCLDISHAIRCSDNWEEIYDNNFGRIKVIHFYGPETEGEGHTGLQKAERSFVTSVTDKILSSNFSELLTLEVFGTEDFFESKRILEEQTAAWERRFSSQVE
ncbi:MAG TPA: cobamide remodeling phosphodiesterase CbiR [Thermodesulfobacteriota bacterium]|jgi:sugar phosphate isomerase/epimerase